MNEDQAFRDWGRLDDAPAALDVLQAENARLRAVMRKLVIAWEADDIDEIHATYNTSIGLLAELDGVNKVGTVNERRMYTTVYRRLICFAPESIFMGEDENGHIQASKWEDIPERWQRIIKKMGGLPCDGGGIPGPWCIKGDCLFFQMRESDYAPDEV